MKKLFRKRSVIPTLATTGFCVAFVPTASDVNKKASDSETKSLIEESGMAWGLW